ncbi:unnamed protein product [Phytophthora lilii]|uniref:Unnamed protein product n=1 Tax=Phytophthora lilii TaxID=2077276 RepID=A0A9W6TH94_9STRA|nr:unnamed protein product [Phytophthora lilii]
MGISDTNQVTANIVIRQFRAVDLPQVVEVFKGGMRSYAPFRALPEQMEAYFQKSLNDDLADIMGTYITSGGNFWVATSKEEPTEVVGIVGLEPKDNQEGELRRMSVKDTYRRFGVGRKLIVVLEEWAQSNGFRKVWLTTGGVMDKARAFYSSMGYEQTAITVVNESPRFEAYTFEKRLRNSVVVKANGSPKDEIESTAGSISLCGSSAPMT